MTEIVVGLGLILAIEGTAYALFPNTMRHMIARVLAEPTERVRQFGLICAIVGVGLVWWLRS
tara:strand:- start:677 stop:862 length:186 start_codon:yes stop_codon:yes gene_type:complete